MGDERVALWGRIEAHLGEATGQVAQVLGLRPLAGGACQDNLAVELELGGARGRWVLRSDAPGGLAGSLRRREEFEVIGRAVAAGVPTPAAAWPSEGLVRPGAGAYFLAWREGVAIGRKVLRDPGLERARARLPAQLAEALARVHALRPPDPGLFDGAPAPADPAEAALGSLRQSLDRLPVPLLGVELALRWLEDHPPAPGPVVLVHGDFRVGNFLVGPEGLEALLDWEFAHWGSPYEDLAWLCVRDWRFGKLHLPVGGLCEREPFYEAYAAASGAPVDPAAARWWEVYGNARWAVGAAEQAERYLEGGEADLELLAIGRRSAEMEWEALRLIGGGHA